MRHGIGTVAPIGLGACLAVATAISPSSNGQVGVDVLISDHPEFRSPITPHAERGMDPISASMFADSTEFLAGLQPCCSSFNELTYIELPGTRKLQLHHGSPDTAMVTPHGKIYVTALALPAKRRRNRLQVSSVIGWHPPSVGISPEIIFLDAQGQSIKGDVPVEVGRARAGGERLRATIPDGAVRALVVTNEDSVGNLRMQCREVGGSMVMAGKNTIVPTPGQTQCWMYPLGVVGAIEARLVR